MSNFTLSFYFEEKLKVKNTCIKTESEKNILKYLGWHTIKDCSIKFI